MTRPPRLTRAYLLDIRQRISKGRVEIETPDPARDLDRLYKAAHRRGWRWCFAKDDRRVYIWMEK